MSLRPLVFTPRREPAGVLEARTVGREDVLTRLERALAAAGSSRNRSHVLLVGPRGSGKSHVVSLAEERARKATYGDRLTFVVVPEDALGFTRFDDLLRHALVELGGSHATTTGHSTVDLQGLISDALRGRVLVLVIENLDRVMASLGVGGERSFRSWVEMSGEVLVLATTPLLFAGVRDRDRPWFGAFDVIRLDGLSGDQGHDLLTRLAELDEDEELTTFLATDRGRARVRALAELAGGSPRIWLVLRDCLTPASLDKLVPAVQQLMEELTPYYQQLLWSLPAQQQRVVRALAEGPSATMTVAEIAVAADEPKGISTILRRLESDHWVERVAPDLPDKRRSWYRLREPMLRHHVQYRSGDHGVLSLIVTILKIAYDDSESTRQLARPDLAPVALDHLIATFDAPRASDLADNDRDVDSLLAEARLWMQDDGSWSFAETGRFIDTTLTATDRPDSSEVVALLRSAEGRRLLTARSQVQLEVICACWDEGLTDAERVGTLNGLDAAIDPDDPLGLLVRREFASWTGAAGDHPRAASLLHELEVAFTKAFGTHHPDTLRVRSNRAYETGETGDHATARDLYATLITDSARVLGTDHPHTIKIRHHHAYQTGKTGDHATARDLYATLITDSARVLGTDHPHTLTTRYNHAWATGQGGNHLTARDLYAILIGDRTRILGADHPDTLDTRYGHAKQTRQSGDYATARVLHTALVLDHIRALGADDARTSDSRLGWAVNEVELDAVAALRWAVAGDSPDGRVFPDDACRRMLMGVAVSQSLRTGLSTGVGVVDLMIEASQGSQESHARLPAELQTIVARFRERS